MATSDRRGARRLNDTDRPVRQEVQADDPKPASAANRSARSDAWKVGFRCQVCSHEADATLKPDRDSGEPRWHVGSAFTSRCPGGGDCLRAIAAELGTTAPALKHDPVAHLQPWLTATPGRHVRRPEALPTEVEIAGWRARLERRQDALDYLWRVRGISPETVRRFEIGYGSFHGRPNALMQPVRDASCTIINLIESYWPLPWRPKGDGDSRKVRTLTGHPAALYPLAVLQQPGPVGLVLTEGRWKALGLIEAKLPAITATNGTFWKPEWTALLADRCVAVLYDVDAEEKAALRAEEFRAAGIYAWPVQLSNAGFSDKDGVDNALRSGWSAGELRRFILRCRRGYRREDAA